MTTAEVLVLIFLRAEAVGSCAILAVFALRGPVRRLFGAELAYRLWLLPLVVMVASLFPTLREFIQGETVDASPIPIGGWIDWTPIARNAGLLAQAWAAGTCGLGAAMVWSEWRFKRLMRLGRAGPAVVGVAWPQLVVPSDYRSRFTPAERAFILEHERVHMARKDPKANLLIAVFQVAGWFNPFMHAGAVFARLDQELACDAVVIERHPKARRAYAEALLKAQVPGLASPLACFWTGLGHPLELRIQLLARQPVSLGRYMIGASCISAIWVASSVLLWAFAPV